MVWQSTMVTAGTGLMLIAGAAAGQPLAKRVRYKVACPSCSIEFTPVASIGGRNDTVSLARNSFLERDSQGRYFAIGDNFQVLVYDARGRLLRALGRRGDGPGEFNSRIPIIGIYDVVVGVGDSVFAFHPPKVTVFSPELVYVRTISALPLSNLQSKYALADGTWLIAGANRAPEHGGRTAFIVDPDGTIRRSLGPGQEPGRTHPMPRVGRFTLPPDQRSLWYADERRYFFSQWSIDGRQLGTIEIHDAPFLPKPKSVTRRTDRGQIYQALEGGVVMVTGIDSTGMIWVWSRPPGAKPAEGLLEVIDPQSGEIRVSQKATKPVWLLPSGDLAFSPTADNDGFLTFVVSKYRFVRR